jgi:hypothetical protein
VDIYAMSMSSLPTRVYLDTEFRVRPLTFLRRVLPGICHINKKLGQEAIVAWVHRTSFVPASNKIHHAFSNLFHWLERFADEKGTQAVRLLTLPNLSLIAPSAIRRTMIQPCQSLQFLSIKVDTCEHASVVQKPHGSGYDLIMKTIEELAKEFGQNAIFKAPTLKTSRSYCEAGSLHVLNAGSMRTMRKEEFTVNLRHMLKQGLEKNGKSVNIEFDFREDR